MIRFIEGIELKDVLSGGRFVEKDDYYEANDEFFGECIVVYKKDKSIINAGFTGLISDWTKMGYLEFIK